MSEEASGILSGDAVERRSERLFQRLDGARGVRRRISPCPNGPSSRSVKLAGIRTRRHTIGLMPTSQSLICKSGVGAGVRATAWLAVVGWLGCTRRAGVAGTGTESCTCLIGAQMPRPRCVARGDSPGQASACYAPMEHQTPTIHQLIGLSAIAALIDCVALDPPARV